MKFSSVAYLVQKLSSSQNPFTDRSQIGFGDFEGPYTPSHEYKYFYGFPIDRKDERYISTLHLYLIWIKICSRIPFQMTTGSGALTKSFQDGVSCIRTKFGANEGV